MKKKGMGNAHLRLVLAVMTVAPEQCICGNRQRWGGAFLQPGNLDPGRTELEIPGN